MKLADAIATISKEWHVFFAWIETLIHHHQAGTLPPAPQPGQSAIIAGTATSAAPPAEPAPAPATALANLPAGVTYVDSVNGLFKIDAADAVYPAQLYCLRPDLAGIPADTQAFATGNWNSSSAKMSDEGLGLWARVDKMVPAKNADGSEGWTRAYPLQWIDNAWSIGAEFDTWDKVIAKAVEIATNLAKAAANTGGGSGFVPHH